jgi:hypothetical protein
MTSLSGISASGIRRAWPNRNCEQSIGKIGSAAKRRLAGIGSVFLFCEHSIRSAAHSRRFITAYLPSCFGRWTVADQEHHPESGPVAFAAPTAEHRRCRQEEWMSEPIVTATELLDISKSRGFLAKQLYVTPTNGIGPVMTKLQTHLMRARRTQAAPHSLTHIVVMSDRQHSASPPDAPPGSCGEIQDFGSFRYNGNLITQYRDNAVMRDQQDLAVPPSAGEINAVRGPVAGQRHRGVRASGLVGPSVAPGHRVPPCRPPGYDRRMNRKTSQPYG